ncbi:putative serine/threonine-protein kinase PBL28 [Bidens hawaiensis]|uniref:putative serine/threonine-protein kinase PBL28 n=1 Tax=Bidens hawaiensis TaxID=980011 RepID=UPI00404AB7FE
MASAMKEFEHLKIQLEELKKATNSFGSKVIGTGGFGKVYQGEVLHSKGRSMVAIKRLNRFKEIMTLSRYTHKNLISLLGFCDEDDEKILVYEHASNGSLDRHLGSTILTWTQRLKICLDAARGLAYLHDHKGTQHRILHRDILLDDNWNAKLSDMGLSKIGLANQRHTVLFTNVVGTPGYCDPQYMYTYTLTKESDVYSFGVVLFEVLCGRLCYIYTNGELVILVPMWKQSYGHKKIDEIIFKDLMPPLDLASLEIFSDIAFQCLHGSRELRPTMPLVVKKLEIALKFQERHDMKRTNVPGASQKHTYVDEASALHSEGKGLFVNMGKMIREAAKGRDVDRSGGSAAVEGGKLVHFDNSVVITAGELFHARNERISETTYGNDYKAKLQNGDEVVVKRLREQFTKNHKEFEIEVNLVGKIRHPNLLATRAYYLDPKRR